MILGGVSVEASLPQCTFLCGGLLAPVAVPRHGGQDTGLARGRLEQIGYLVPLRVMRITVSL